MAQGNGRAVNFWPDELWPVDELDLWWIDLLYDGIYPEDEGDG